MLVKFNHELLLKGASMPTFAHVTVGTGNPVALQFKDKSPPSSRVLLPFIRLTDICTGTEKSREENGNFISND